MLVHLNEIPSRRHTPTDLSPASRQEKETQQLIPSLLSSLWRLEEAEETKAPLLSELQMEVVWL